MQGTTRRLANVSGRLPRRTSKPWSGSAPSEAVGKAAQEKKGQKGIFAPRLLLLGGIFFCAIGIFCLVVWGNWAKWVLLYWQARLPQLPPQEASELLIQMSLWTPESIPLLVEGLCDPRQDVAETASRELQNLRFQWENQAWHQVVESVLLLAKSLEERKSELPPHSWGIAQELAEWILRWRPPVFSPERVEMVFACEKILAYLRQNHPPSQAMPSSSSAFSLGEKRGLAELFHPLAGLQAPGGGLTVEAPFESVDAEPAVSTLASASIGEEKQSQQGGQAEVASGGQGAGAPTGPSTLVIRSAGGWEEGGSQGKYPRMNHALRVGPQERLGEESREVSAGSAKELLRGKADQSASAKIPEASGGSLDSRLAKRGPGGQSVQGKPDSFAKTETRELVSRLAEASGEEQLAIQGELARRGFGKVSPEFARWVVDSRAQVRLELVRQLPAMPGVEAASWLLWLCEDPDPQVRSAAQTLLATTNDPAVLQHLEKILAASPEESFRRYSERIRSLRQQRLR